MDVKTRDVDFEVKSLDEDLRIIEGIASTGNVDRMGDIVEPKGARFALPVKMLWQHQKDKPIGHVIEATVTDAGIRIKAQLERGILPYIDEAWALIKSKLVGGLSIGFRPLKAEPLEDKNSFGFRFKEWEWLELSAVTIAANSDAGIHTIKAIDDRLLAVCGGKRQSDVIQLDRSSPGVPGVTVVDVRGKQVKTTAETIIEFQGRRNATAGQMVAMMEAANEKGCTLSNDEQEQYDGWERELKNIDEHLVRLNKLEVLTVQRATPITVVTGSSQTAASEARGGNIISVRRNLPKATTFARYAQAIAISKGNLMLAAEIVKRPEWKDTPELQPIMKAAVAAGTTGDADWAAPLVEYQTMASEFIDLLRPATIVGQLTGLKQVPFNIRVAGKTQGSSVNWVGEGLSKPVSELKFNEVLLGFAKAAGIVVITKELARFSSPAAEGLIRDDLRDSIAQFLDEQFIDPAIAAVANVHPASVTNGVTPIPSSGGTLGDINTDLTTLFGNLSAAGISPVSGAWVTTPAIAIGLSMMRTSQDVFAFPTMTMTGGTLQGFPVVVSDSVPSGLLVFIVQREVFLADDGAVTIDASEQASVELDSAPSTPAASLVSLWQQNLVGIRAERFINWAKRRAAAVQMISAVVPAPGAALAAARAA